MTEHFKNRNRKRRISDYDELDYQQKSSRKSNKKAPRDNFDYFRDVDNQNSRVKDVSRFKNRNQPRRSNKRDQKRYDNW